jgi:[ribosomal protein S5]-alanine N-acetyltransferase
MYYEEYKLNYKYTTNRLIVKEWSSFEPKELEQPDLVNIVEEMLVPDVTKRFPVMWRGDYDKKRAKFWIQERDSESKTLLAVEKETKKPLGYINFFKEGDRSRGTYLRLGYLVSKAMWNNGLATELVEGFIHWCKENSVSTILARVEPDNIASIRVLEKNNFLSKTTDANGVSLLFVYNLI